jgi:Ni,Fe-hydrogenase III component G
MQKPPTLADIIGVGRRIEAHRPWPRVVVDEEAWRLVADGLVTEQWTLSGLWADAEAVHIAVLDEAARDMAVLSLSCPQGHFPSVGQYHPPAIRLERAIHDLFGLKPEDAPDARPWLDHGRWGLRHPLGTRTADAKAEPYAFLEAEGESLHQIAFGPVHAGIIEPGHFRFHANGEAIVRLEARLGYAHKGVDALMLGADLERAARLAGRVSGDSTVGYAIAFARAVEAALGIEVPARALAARAHGGT